VDTLVPPYFEPRFVGLVSALALLLAGGWAELRRRERNASDIRKAHERARTQLVAAMLERMSAAATGLDPTVFFNSARSVLQQTLGARWDIAPEIITVADIDSRIEGADRDDLRQIFALADEANYSGDKLKAADFERWTQVVRRQLAGEVPS
jgi:hypothetical protein